jgi:site-specific recombinase XerD
VDEEIVVQIPEATLRFLDHRRAANRAASTISLYRRQLQTWLQWLVAHERPLIVADLTIDELRDFFASLRDEGGGRRKRVLSENTRASYHRTLRAFWGFLAIEPESGLTLDQQRFFLRITAPAVPEEPRPVADEDAMLAIAQACGDGHTEESARNRAIVFLLYESGMRISELCSLTDELVNHKRRQAQVLRAKGGKHRKVFWQSGAAAALGRYLLLRRGLSGGPLPLFRGCSIRNNGGAITADSVRATVKRIASAADLTLPKGAPLHSLRHGFAHAAIEGGAELSDLADLLGHADLETTRIYVRNDDTRLEAAYDRIFRRKSRGHSARGDGESHG